MKTRLSLLSLLSLLAFVLLSFNINAQDAESQNFDGANCTSIMVGKDADIVVLDTDYSVIQTYCKGDAKL